MRVITEKAINNHFDKCITRMMSTAMPSATERLTEKIEEERREALELFKRNGYIEVREVGQAWEIKKPKTSEAQRAATERYEAKTKAGVYLKLNKNTDADILSKLDEVESKQGYIKELIRADIQKKIGQK